MGEKSLENVNNPFTIFVEGNVGSGKSTFLEHFKKSEDFLVLEEPVDQWTKFHGLNLLDLKFADPEKFQFPFQTYATLTRLKQHLQPCEKPFKLMERSLLSARRCFVENLHDTGLLNSGMFYVLDEWYNFINETHQIKCDAIIYLRTTPEVAAARVRARARSEEETISEDYLKQLHERHEKLFVKSEILSQTPVIIVDANQDLEHIETEYLRCLKEIQQLHNSTGAKSSFIQI